MNFWTFLDRNVPPFAWLVLVFGVVLALGTCVQHGQGCHVRIGGKTVEVGPSPSSDDGAP